MWSKVRKFFKESTVAILSALLVAIALTAIIAVAYVAKVTSKSEKVEDSESIIFDTTSARYKAIKKGYDNLVKYDKNYLIADTLAMPSDTMYYIEVKTADGNYTEFPVDSDGNYGKTSFADAKSANYVIYDYMTADDKLYTMDSRDTTDTSKTSSFSWVHMPESYAKDVSGRTTLYMDKYLDSLYNIESKGKQTIETDAGSFEYTVYTANIPSSVVKDVCGIDTLGLYKHVKEDNSGNANIGKLMDVYINNLDDTLTFSKGTISFGIDGNGVLTYVQLSAGGLGTSMKYTKEVVLNPSLDFRSLPDFSQSKEFVDNITDLANYVAKYDSYDDAMKALYKTDSDSTVSGNSSSSTDSSSSEVESNVESSTVTESNK